MKRRRRVQNDVPLGGHQQGLSQEGEIGKHSSSSLDGLVLYI